MDKLNVQEYLSLGYLYLLVLGLITDSLYYGFLDVNILDYSAISDVLLSPLKLLTRHRLVLIAFSVIIGLLIAYSKWFHPRLAKTEAQVLTREKVILIAAVMIVGYFLGLGIGLGIKTKEQLREGKTRQDHEITFSNSTTLSVKIVGRNSLYIFYVLKGGREVLISPIDGNILTIKKTPPR